MDKYLSIYDCMVNYIRENPATVFYQTHTWDGKIVVNGIMGDEKNNYISIDDIKGKTILDLGCATGATCLWAAENGASKVIGIDSGAEQINIFNHLASYVNDKCEINGYVHKLNRGIPPMILEMKIDTLLCFAITQYIGYRKIWHEIPSAKVVYLLGGIDSNYTESSLSDNLYKAKFITFLPNNKTDKRLQRQLFRLERIENNFNNDIFCKHQLKNTFEFSDTAREVECEICNKKYVIKPSVYFDIDILPIAANEYISYKLLMLIKSKGIDINVAKIALVTKEQVKKSLNIENPLAIIEHLGEHSRISEKTIKLYREFDNLKFPNWIYWFDKWIGRLDGDADSNLLLTIDNKIIPVDFAMSFHWACGDEDRIIKIDFIDVPYIDRIYRDSSQEVRNVIKSLTDEEIYKVLFDEILYPEFISRNILISYYTGLCFRRDIL